MDMVLSNASMNLCFAFSLQQAVRGIGTCAEFGVDEFKPFAEGSFFPFSYFAKGYKL